MLKESDLLYVYSNKRMPSKKQKDDDYTEYNDHMSHQGNAVKMRRRRYFPTRHGGFCINAVTGVRDNFCQGSYESLRLYQVIDSSGTCDSKGYVRSRWDPSNQTPNFLYYDSPEQYSRHQKVEVSGKAAYQWHNDVKKMFPDDKFDKEAYLEIRRRKHGIGEVAVSSQKHVSESSQNEDDEWN